jgi:hypothetical protein
MAAETRNLTQSSAVKPGFFFSGYKEIRKSSKGYNRISCYKIHSNRGKERRSNETYKNYFHISHGDVFEVLHINCPRVLSRL